MNKRSKHGEPDSYRVHPTTKKQNNLYE
jgi:hypothetical protein